MRVSFFDYREVTTLVEYLFSNGKTITVKARKKHFIIVAAEGVGNTNELCTYIDDNINEIDARLTILGHVQRGGTPSNYDRVMATRMGYEAIELIFNGKYNRIVVLNDSKITSKTIDDAMKLEYSFDMDLYRIAHEVSI